MLSLYLHVPFCLRKCPYCGFYSTVYSEQLANEYLDALHLEAAGYHHAFDNQVIDTVYWGGGTPTVLSLEQMQRLIGVIRDHFLVARDAEWTIEANPNSVSLPQLVSLREAGVNRLSLGIQSFNDKILKALGRLHSAAEAAAAFRHARKAGFSNIGVDLIYGVPGQTTEEWNKTLDETIGLQPEHVSAYSLSLDEGSRFMDEAMAGRFALSEDDQVASLYEHAVEKLGRAGYHRYEVSNFSLPGYACRHNVNYWARGEYLGLGPAAWSFVNQKRYHAVADVREYVARLKTGRSVIEGEEVTNSRQAANETIMLSLRTTAGLDLVRFGKDFGKAALTQLEHQAALLKQQGLLETDEGRIMLTERGLLIANEALARLAL